MGASYGRGPLHLAAAVDLPDRFGAEPYVELVRLAAGDLDTHVREGTVDGFLLAADGLEEFVDRVVPLLQERGVFRTEYQGATLRSHLGPAHPAREG
ncbi:hypothetical protein [Streptomyces sp. NPDC002078]